MLLEMLLLLLPDPGEWGVAEEHDAPEPGQNFPGPGPEVLERDRESPKSEWRKESVVRQCIMR